MFNDPNKHIKTLNSEKLTFNRNNFLVLIQVYNQHVSTSHKLLNLIVDVTTSQLPYSSLFTVI